MKHDGGHQAADRWSGPDAMPCMPCHGMRYSCVNSSIYFLWLIQLTRCGIFESILSPIEVDVVNLYELVRACSDHGLNRIGSFRNSLILLVVTLPSKKVFNEVSVTR